MYKYVKDKLDHSYTQAVPIGQALNENEIPQEEIEIREMVEAWYVSGYRPIIGEDTLFEQYCCAHSLANIEGDWESQSQQQKTTRLQRLEQTLVEICRHRVYFAALTRFLSGLQDCSVKQRLIKVLSVAKASQSKPRLHH
ncbi:hypothetical protein L4C42_01570 [Vibrio wakamikoensis]|uniref:hypothetical protein n=1 Tax=Vibrio wakamikoensis TaxID=2910251 RepID=UPI003D1D405D